MRSLDHSFFAHGALISPSGALEGRTDAFGTSMDCAAHGALVVGTLRDGP